jgi:hypothetical protein
MSFVVFIVVWMRCLLFWDMMLYHSKIGSPVVLVLEDENTVVSKYQEPITQ